MRSAAMLATILVTVGTGCGEGATGSLVIRANGVNEAREGVTAEQTADGWTVEFDSAVIVITDVRIRTMAGDDAMVASDPVAVELVPEPVVAFEIDAVPAQRWDRVSYHLSAPPEDTRAVGVEAAVLDRMRMEGWSAYYAGRFVAPADTVDSEGVEVTQVPFEFGFPVEVDYELCVAGDDGTNGVVIPVSSAADYEITWHMTHLFFDSFVEDSALRVEPMAALWDGEAPLSVADLDVPLGGLRAMDGGPLFDDLGNPVIYIPGMTGADTLREFVLQARPGHFNGLEGFCTTSLRIVD